MKKIKLIVLIFVVFTLSAKSQVQPPNGGFENWDMNVLTQPDSFFTSNVMLPTGNVNVTKVTDAYHGNYAIQLQTVAFGNDTIQGLLLIGTPGNGGISGGIPFTSSPDSISGYVKYNVMQGDTAQFIVGFKKNGTIIGIAATTFTGTQNSYLRFRIPTNLDPHNPPDSLVAVISSSNMNSPKFVGSTITIDSITFINSVEQLPNNDFENWTSVDLGSNPTQWSSFNNFHAYGVPIMSFQTSEVHSGSYALRIISDTATLLPPFGNGSLDTISGFVFVGPPNMSNPGIPYSDKPSYLNGYFKGTLNGLVYVSATLSKWNSVNKNRNSVASAVYATDTSEVSYHYFSVPFNYFNSDIPDTLVLQIMGGDMGPGGIIAYGNELFVDDISFSFPQNISSNIDLQVLVSPNPATGFVFVSSTNQITSIEIINSVGEIVKSVSNNIQQKSNLIDVSDLKSGIYFITIFCQNTFTTRKFVKM